MRGGCCLHEQLNLIFYNVYIPRENLQPLPSVLQEITQGLKIFGLRIIKNTVQTALLNIVPGHWKGSHQHLEREPRSANMSFHPPHSAAKGGKGKDCSGHRMSRGGRACLRLKWSASRFHEDCSDCCGSGNHRYFRPTKRLRSHQAASKHAGAPDGTRQGPRTRQKGGSSLSNRPNRKCQS